MTACLGRRVAELADGRLTGDERARALAHVAVCASCRDAVETQRSMRQRLAGSGAPDPSDDLVSRLRRVPDVTAAVSLSGVVSLAEARARRRRSRVALAGGSAIVGAIALIGGVASLGQTAASVPVIVPNLSSFAAEHASMSGAVSPGGTVSVGSLRGIEVQSAGLQVDDQAGEPTAP